MIARIYNKARSELQKIRQATSISRAIYQDYKKFKKLGITPDRSVFAMRQLFVLTNSRSNEIFSRLVRKPQYQHKSYPGVFQDLSKEGIADFLKAMHSKGFYIFKQTLSDQFVEDMVRFASTTPARVLEQRDDGEIVYSKEKKIIDFQNPVSPRYQFENDDILSSPEVQALIFDESILNLSQLYLNTAPYFDVLAMWWSLPFGGVGKSEAAQMYHFDLDKMKFIKFFFYLSDVDSQSGPHCYVTHTHHGVPADICKDGRQEDEEIERAVGKERMVEICGKKGTIIAVDTRGLHKGKELTKGYRLLFQTMFSDSLFGANYPDFDLRKIAQPGREVISKYPEAFKKFKIKRPD
ncbi:MAG TPA: hypothetical protein VKR32_07135 [Puia sp.]|nr:hypothetical protein [Puia sp.]